MYIGSESSKYNDGLINNYNYRVHERDISLRSLDVSHHAGSFSCLALKDNVLDAYLLNLFFQLRLLLVIVRDHPLHELMSLFFWD